VTLPALPRRSGDLVFGSHLVLALSMMLWRAFESLPGYSAEDGGSFTSSQAGRLLAFATLVACVLAALAVAVQTWRRWRDPRVGLLALLFALALTSRTRADLFDLVYAGLAVAFAVWWFRSERAGAQARA
jgi:O-antigen ligase